MNWAERYNYQRPDEDRVYLERTPVDATCPGCGGDDVRRYPVAAHLGPRIATKCQACFHVLALERPTADDAWPPFRSVTFDWLASPAEGGPQSRD